MHLNTLDTVSLMDSNTMYYIYISFNTMYLISSKTVYLMYSNRVYFISSNAVSGHFKYRVFDVF